MSIIRRLDTNHKLYLSFALLLCLSMGLSLWMLGQLGQMTLLTARVGHKLGGAAEQAQAGYAGARVLAWFAIGVTLAAAAVLALWLRAEVARPVQQAAAMARRVAGGDLSGKITPGTGGDGGALLLAMQEMNDKLAGMIVKVRAGTESIAGSAGQIAAGSMSLSARTVDQAAALEDTAAAMAQLSSTVRLHTEHAHEAGKLAASACDVASRGGAMVAQMAGSMTSANDSSRRITELIGVIDASAFQTNVLALKVALEAARAGEPGRAFAVAAGEVGNLARHSAAAAREIRLLIDASAERAAARGVLADQAGKTMHEVIASVRRVGAMVGEIIEGCAGQGAGLEQVSQAIAALERATRHNAALVEQSAVAAASMRDQAGRLSRATAAFVLGPEYGTPVPAIRLVSSNPHWVAKANAPAGARAKPAAVRSCGAAVRRDVDWEEF